MVLAVVGRRVDRRARRRRLGDAVAHDQVEVHADQAEHHGRDQEDVGGVEAGQRRAADRLAGEEHVDEQVADQRQPRGLRREQPRPPSRRPGSSAAAGR